MGRVVIIFDRAPAYWIVRENFKMFDSLPLSLIVSWGFFFGFLKTHLHNASDFQGESQGCLLALQISVLIGSLVGLCLLGYYFMLVAWYWPIVLYIGGSLISGLIFSFILEVMIGKLIIRMFVFLLDFNPPDPPDEIGQLIIILLAFIGWPASAIWVFLIIRGIQP